MRTTVTLDDDLFATLQQLAKERSTAFKDVLNGTLRRGLAEPSTAAAQPWTMPSGRLGLRPGIDLDQAMHLVADLEDEEIVRKLELRK